MWRESASTANVRSCIGVPSAPLWIAVFACGHDVSDDIDPKPGVFYVFQSMCAFWEADHTALEKVEELGIGNTSRTMVSEQNMYRWAYQNVDDIVMERDPESIRVSTRSGTFKLSKVDEFEAVCKALNFLRTATAQRLLAIDEVSRAALVYPESTRKVKLMGSDLEEAEYVVQEIDGAIVTNLRIFFATSVVKLGSIMMMQRGTQDLRVAVNKGLTLSLRCSPYRQGLLIRLWLARLPITAYWDSPGKANLQTERSGFSVDEFEMKRQIIILERLHKQFCAIDKSGNGLIEFEECDEVMRPVFACTTFVECFFRALDADGNGVISFVEFASGMCDLLTSNVVGKIKFSFRMFDVDGDGCISEDEMLAILKSLVSTGDVSVGDDIMIEVCESLFTLIDLDGSGVISGDEYSEALQTNPQVHELLRRIGLSTAKHSAKATIADLAEDMICFGDPDWLLCSSLTQALLVGLNQCRSNSTLDHDGQVKVAKEPLPADFLVVQRCPCSVTAQLVREHGAVDPALDDKVETSASDVVVYAPKVFDYLRSCFKITLQDYQQSLGLRNIAANMLLGSVETLRQPQWDASHRFSFVSNDNRFLVHSIGLEERNHLLRMLPQYVPYIKNNPNTLLPRLIGVHSINNGTHSLTFIVTCNAILNEEKLAATYYFKGIEGRSLSGKLAERDLQAPLALAPGWRATLQQQLTKDAMFLSASECVGYSLVCAVKRIPVVATPVVKSDFVKQLEAADRKSKTKKQSSGWCCAASSTVVEEEEEVQEHQRGTLTTGTTLESSTMFSQATTPGPDVSSLSIFHEYVGGIRTITDDPAYIAIVSAFTPVEAGEPEDGNPEEYRERFTGFLRQVIVGADEEVQTATDRIVSGPDMIQYSLTRENGKKGSATLDMTKKFLHLSNHTSSKIASIALDASDAASFVKPLGASEKAKTELVIRSGFEAPEKGRLPTFRGTHRLRFLSFEDRYRFLSDVTKGKLSPHVGAGMQTSTVRIWIGTWNVGDAPPGDMRPFLSRAFGFDIVVLSVQECNYQVKGANPTRSCESDFFSAVCAHFSDYAVVVSTSLWTIRMIILVKTSHAHRVSSVKHCNEATGIGHVMGNKGGIAVAMKYDNSTLCFVGSHLAAHLEKIENRNSDFKEIVEGVSGTLGMDGVDVLNSFHHVFWCGDLNYRIEKPFNEVLRKAVAGEVEDLHSADQLQREMKKGNVFVGFTEPSPTFTPTYRFLRDTDPTVPRLYDEWKHRIPSWCDRILHKSLGNSIDAAKRTAYDAVHDVRSSDHSPVFASFETQIRGEYVEGSAGAELASSISITNLRCEGLLVADTFGLSDPWITFSCPLISTPLKEAKTRTIWKTLEPEWTEAFELTLFAVELPLVFSEYITFIVRDADYAGTNDPLGQAVLPLDRFAARPFEPQQISIPIMLFGEKHGTLSATIRLKTTK